MTREEAINEIKSWAIPSKKGREVLETLIPELVDSKDEEIRKDIIEYLKLVGKGDSDYAQPMINRWIAYLEKQKEATPCSVDEFTLTLRNCLSTDSELTKEQADIFATVYGKELLNVAIGKVKSGLTKEDIDDFKTEKQKEQKSAEWSEDKFPKDIEKDATQFCFDKGFNITPYQAKEIATHYLMVGHNFGYVEGRKNANIPAKELGLPSSMDFKQEWSDEDEKIMQTMIKDGDLKPSEVAWLKSRRPSWKPSEEHFQGLRRAITKAEKGSDAWNSLTDLYEQLKKL